MPKSAKTIPDPPLRAQILQAIEAAPGMTPTMLWRRLRATTGNERIVRSPILWHLDVLVRSGRAIAARSGRSQHYYPSRGPWAANPGLWAFVQSPKRWRIARMIAIEGPLTVTQIRSRPTADANAWQVRRVLRALRARGLLMAKRQGITVTYEATTRLRQIVHSLVEPVS